MALSSVPRDTGEGRAFLQHRIALFGKILFLLFLGLITVGGIVMLSVFGTEFFARTTPPFHVIPIVVGLAVVWLVCRSGERSARTLAILDALSTILLGAAFAVTLLVAPAEIPSPVPVTLSLTHLLIIRAIIIPSDWPRTLWISALAALPTAVLIFAGRYSAGGVPRLISMMLPVWSLFAVVIATWTSHVLYRLRRSVQEARTLGQYTLESKIGEGGMGVVYSARHAMLRRPTVVKLLPPEKAGQANLIRFEREVQLTSQLTSPHTVAIYDFGRTPDGIFYYAMEHLDGVDLEKLVTRDGAQPAARVIHVMAQVCDALTEAHDAGLIHRDVKPSNIMLCRQGGKFDVAKVLDFGLVKDVARVEGTRLTQAHSMLGTPLYVSPEGITEPDNVDARADLYSLGAVAYYLLTGKFVFDARTVAEVCGHHLLSKPVPPSQRNARAVPADLESLVLRCLEKSPDDRPRDARALRTALLACADAGRWTQEDARAAWHAPAAPREEPVALSHAKTLNVDLVER